MFSKTNTTFVGFSARRIKAQACETLATIQGRCFPPQKGAVCANPEDKNSHASNRAYFLFAATSLRDPIKVSLTLAPQASETRANSGKR